MPSYLEAVEGPAKGRKVELRLGGTITIGRTNRSMVSFAEDECMSGLHMAVGLSNGTVRVQNMSKTNGTLVNGVPIEAVAVQPGDQIKTGDTTFVVVGPAPSPFPVRMRVGGWGFETFPDGWQPTEGFGFRYPVSEPFRPSISAVEEKLPKDQTLPVYIQVQIDLAKKHIANVELKEPVETKIKGSDEAKALSLTALVEGKGQVMQHQIYALHNGVVGVLTASALDTQAQLLRDALGQMIPGLSYTQT